MSINDDGKLCDEDTPAEKLASSIEYAIEQYGEIEKRKIDAAYKRRMMLLEMSVQQDKETLFVRVAILIMVVLYCLFH